MSGEQKDLDLIGELERAVTKTLCNSFSVCLTKLGFSVLGIIFGIL